MSNQSRTPIADRGWTKDANMPGDSQGETNGLYAAVSENIIEGDDPYDYFDEYGAGRWQGLLDSITGSRVGQAVDQYASRRVTQAAQRNLAAHAPSLTEQWKALSPFEQIGFVAAVAGLIWALRK